MIPRDAHCPSDLSLDRWLAGELTPSEARVVASHVERCPACEQRRAARLAALARFAHEAPAFAALAAAARVVPRSGPVPRSRRTLLAGRFAAGLAAAASIALAVGVLWRGPPKDDAGTRAKGAPANLGWFVRRGERVFEGQPEQLLRVGDAVRFTIDAREPVFVAVLGLAASGELSVYYPEAAELTRVEAGRGQLLPAAIEIDATPGDERVYAVFCASAVPIASVVTAIERSPEAPALPAGCSSERHTLQQERP